jgi:Rhamnan synthesis protein F
LVRRNNYGYDFFSWKVGLEYAGDLSGYDYVVICNDSFVGPLVPYSRIFATMEQRPCDVWGLTQSRRRTRHVQSFFVAFHGWAARSQAFLRFWADMTPVSNRGEVITRYELGLSKALLAAGFQLGSYFEETEADCRLARARHVWWAAHAIRRQPRAKRMEALRRLPREPWNPMAALADRALDDARLPVVKIDTLRYDPYQLDAERLPTACERRYPAQFAGVRDFLRETEAAYPPRPRESPGPTVPVPPFRQLLGYAR